MNIRNRLGALEFRQNGACDDDAFEQHGETLAAFLGQLDGLMHPNRQGASAIYQRQREYLTTGLSWSGRAGGDAAGWKRNERLRRELVGAGLLEVVSEGRFRLPQRIEYRLRQSCGLPCSREIDSVVISILSNCDHDDCDIRPGGWVVESVIHSDPFIGWEIVAPLIVAGIVESRPSTAGRVFYRRRTGQPYNEVSVQSAEYVERWADAYSEAFCSVMQERKRWQPVDASEVLIPLSATA